MKYYFRYLSLIVLIVWSAQAFALDEIDRFAKKCDLFESKDIGFYPRDGLRSEKKILRQAKVSIHLSFADCKAIRHVIQLENGSTVTLESSYSTNSEPDDKGESHIWNPKSPSLNYWRFDTYGWEWNGFLLINKITGRKFTEPNECHANSMSMMDEMLAVVCQGSYENTVPTLYVLNGKNEKVIWSQPFEIPRCNEGAHYVSRKFEFKNSSTLIMVGDCRPTTVKGNAIVRGTNWVKVNVGIQISVDGLKVNVNGKSTKVNWNTAN